LSEAKKPKKVSHRGSNIDTVGDPLGDGQDDIAGNEQQQPSSQLQDDDDDLPAASKKLKRKNTAGEQLNGGNYNTGGAGGRRGRPPGSVHARSLAENKANYGILNNNNNNNNKSSRNQGEEEGEEGLLPRRSRRSARCAPIYNDDEFALHGDDDIEMEIEEVENPLVDNFTRRRHHHRHGSGSGLAVGEAAAGEAAATAGEAARLHQQRRRRKPLVSSPAPTDVSPLEVGLEEYQALAALAGMPSPMEVTYYGEEEEEVDIDSSVLPATHHPQHRHRDQRTQHQQHHYEDNIGRSGAGQRSSCVVPEHTKLMQRQHRKFEDYHGGGGIGGITSIATAEKMFGQLLGAISCRLGGTTNTTAVNTTAPNKGYNELKMKFSSDTWTSFSHMPAIINVNAELLKAALPFNGSDDCSGSPDTGDEGGGRKPVVPLFC
jgi:hypothetical protein